MYSLDINFLKDRYLETATRPSAFRARKERIWATEPLIIGAVIGLLLPIATVGFWLFWEIRTAQLNQNIAVIDEELNQLEAQQQRIQQIEGQIEQVNAGTSALASVFNQIKPWSAILQEIRDRTPNGVQISSIQQGETASSSSEADDEEQPEQPLPTTQVTISGIALSYSQVNDFLLTLQQSNFFNGEQTQLQSASSVDYPETELKKPENSESQNLTIELPQVVEYTIQTELSNQSASELLQELERQGAVGVVTRIRTLKEEGVIQP